MPRVAETSDLTCEARGLEFRVGDHRINLEHSS